MGIGATSATMDATGIGHSGPGLFGFKSHLYNLVQDA